VTYLNLVRRLKIVSYPMYFFFQKSVRGRVVLCTTFKLTTKNTILGFWTFFYIHVIKFSNLCLLTCLKRLNCTIYIMTDLIRYYINCVCLCITYQIHTDDLLYTLWGLDIHHLFCRVFNLHLKWRYSSSLQYCWPRHNVTEKQN